MNRLADLLRWRASTDVESDLEIIVDALTISPYSEKLLELKAEALFMVSEFFFRSIAN